MPRKCMIRIAWTDVASEFSLHAGGDIVPGRMQRGRVDTADTGLHRRPRTTGVVCRSPREGERARHPELYEGTGKDPGHMPDLTWAPDSGDLDLDRDILPMDAALNKSIGAQAGRYPRGFVVEECVGGTVRG